MRSPPPTPDAGPPDPARVLVVDDEGPVRDVVRTVLAARGDRVTAVAGVDAALAALAAGRFDVALIDLDMPDRPGLDLLDEMRATSADAVPVLLTGSTSVPAVVAAMKRGAFDYLPKPFEVDALRWTVSRAAAVARSRRRERALEWLVAEWAGTFDACAELLLVIDPAGGIVRANAAVARRVGAAAEELAGRPVAEVFPGGLGAAIGAGTATRVYDAGFDGHFQVGANPVRGRGGRVVGTVVAATEVTDLIRAEEDRVHLLRQVFTAQEDERRRISRELHDGIGQALVSLSLGLASLADATDDGTRDRAARLGRVAAEALADTRRLAHGLRPPALDDLGLPAALSRLVETFNEAGGARAELAVPAYPPRRLPTDVESAAYRIAQEALANVAKHSRAWSVDLILEAVHGELYLVIADDGVGFAPTGRPDQSGLAGMRERAYLLGGALRVESDPGRGTTVSVRLPVPEGLT